MPEEAPPQAKPFPDVDFGPPPPRPGPARGPADNGAMQRLALMIEQIMAAHAGGYNSPCQVEVEEGQIEQTTPAQIMSDLCEAVWELELTTRKLTEAILNNTELAESVGEEEEEPPARRRRK